MIMTMASIVLDVYDNNICKRVSWFSTKYFEFTICLLCNINGFFSSFKLPFVEYDDVDSETCTERILVQRNTLDAAILPTPTGTISFMQIRIIVNPLLLKMMPITIDLVP